MKSGDISYADRLRNRQPGSEMTGKYFDPLKTEFYCSWFVGVSLLHFSMALVSHGGDINSLRLTYL